ncbi:MerR family transcriptional regulator [Georgenia sp. MJ173]|uniref:MerR family transcriptional regulator n=1 Tax=Georgenia sunbinii TaxID=3117728 RepID=UPI002F267D6A
MRAVPADGQDADGGGKRLDTAPLTVAGVARALGVAASTLRTWDRRYGLGPSAHQAGSHRRYTPQDVARLQVMRRLTLRGVAPVDAARIATETDGGAAWLPSSGPSSVAEAAEIVVDPLTLAAAVVEPDLRRVGNILSRAVEASGLVEAWTTLVLPAREMLAQRRQAAALHPGADPEGLLEAAVMQAVRDSGPRNGTRAATTDGARVLTSRADRLVAHVVAGGIAERHVPALVVRVEDVDLDDGALGWLTPAQVLVVVGSPPGAEEIVTTVAASGTVEIFLLGREAPSLFLPHVHRVRTLPAAVAESVAAVSG